MKNMRKLNKKGFTLVELLAVVVILAVVMGIAATSVLSSMNSSRKGSLVNSAESASQIFQNNYAEAMITGTTTSVLGKYNFTTATKDAPKFYAITSTVASDLNLSDTSYVLGSEIDITLSESGATNIDNSFVAFNGEKVVVCLIAKNSGSYYVGQATSNEITNKSILGKSVSFDANVMYACSDEQRSW